MKKNESSGPEALLRSCERRCMNACNRYLNRSAKDNVWTLYETDGKLCALIVFAKQSLLPVLCGTQDIPPPRFLRGFFGTAVGHALVHSVQGLKEDALVLETAMEKIGLFAVENINYDTMCIDHRPGGFDSSGPAGLVIRNPRSADMDALAALHAAYEQEEVLPAGSAFNAAVSRLNMEKIFRNEQVLVAELDGRLVGKINTNAATFTRCQIGGVYVHPDYRGRGIARRMAGEFAANLVSGSKGISLFVKKSNTAARNVYLGIGFEIAGDYRISYY